ncbi:HYR domain-containing protein [Paenibacillus sp. M1]|uniref:HYR domain-containing protein n=1 Tax=Paenibacillus haidiansis TaxID=1574488 RepID=A0ABU7VVJ0_9BACL
MKRIKPRVAILVCLVLLAQLIFPVGWLAESSQANAASPANGKGEILHDSAIGADTSVDASASQPAAATEAAIGTDEVLGTIIRTPSGVTPNDEMLSDPVTGTLSAVSPLLQQMKLSQATSVIPGGRGYMTPQVVVVKDLAGNPLAGVPVTFEAVLDNSITVVMRGLNSNVITVLTDANGYASAANTNAAYLGEGYQVYSQTPTLVKTLDLKATVQGLTPVTFKVEIGTFGSNLTDKTPPTITASAKDDTGAGYTAGTWTNRSVTVHYTATDTLSAIKYCTPDQVFATEGAGQTATGKAIDSAATSDDDKNHYSTVTFGPINIDKSAPVTTVTGAPAQGAWSRSPVSLQFQATDTLSGVQSIDYKLGDDAPVITTGSSAAVEIGTEGITNVSYWAVDKTGNAEAAKTLAVKIDTTVPTLTSQFVPDKNANGWNNSDVAVTLTAADASSGVKEIHYKIGEHGTEQVVNGATATFSAAAEGIMPVSYWAVDAAGNTSPVRTTEVKIDKTNPVITPPADKTVEATAVLTPVDIGTATVQDVSVQDVQLTNDAPGAFPIGTTTVKWTAKDPVGNISTQVQKITVKDTTKPVLTVPGDIVVEATALRTPIALGGAVATDIFPVTVFYDAPEDFPVGTTKVKWTATDPNGNEVVAYQNVTVVDSKKPLLVAPADITVEATGRRTPVEIGTATASDIFGVTVTNNAPQDYPVGTTKVVWKATDENGNVALAEQLVTIADTTKPVLEIPEDITVEATAIRTALDIGQAKATDLFDVIITNNAPEDYPVGITKVLWTAKDENGNVTTLEQKITVTDKTLPVLIAPKDIVMEATGIKTAVDLGQPTATDIFPVTVTHNAPDSFSIGKTVVTWTATDENGNVVKQYQNITIADTTKPLLTVPGDKTVEATAVRTPVNIGQPAVSDIFPVTVTNDAPADFPLGTTVVTWTAIDENGNRVTGTQNITVVDTTKPVVKVPADIQVEATGIRTPVNIGEPWFTDIFPVMVTNDAPEDFPIGITKVTWKIWDPSGNTVIVVQKVTVVDTTQPALHLPPDVTVEATAVRTPVNIGQATATDLFKVTITNDAPEDYPVGTTKVTWTAADENGNKLSGTQNVTVTDTTAPVLTVPEDIRVEATSVSTVIDDIGQGTATDIFPVTITNNAPEAYPLGKTTVTWKATDANGNISTGAQTITVVDTTAPGYEEPAEVTVEATGNRTAVTLTQPAVTDIYKIIKISNDAPEDYPIGTTVVTWTFTDENGNTSTASQKVTIVDTTQPVLTIPGDMTVEATEVLSPVSIGTATATDLFDVTVSNDAPEAYPIGTTKVAWKATDANGNESVKVQNITVVDTTKPELTIPADMTVEATAVRSIVNIGDAVATDIFPTTVTNDAPEDYPIGVTKVIWKAKDNNGNEVVKVQTVTVVDTTGPELTVPWDLSVEATAVTTPVTIGLAEASDIFPVTVTNDAPAAYPVGTTKVTWIATDANGNVTTKVQSITVADTTKPVLAVSDDVTVEATAVRTPVEIGQATASDIFQVDIIHDAPEDYPIGTTQITWTATDENGNVSTGTQNITVVDTTKPELTVPSDLTVEATAVRTPVAIGTATATDIFPITVTNNAPEDYPLGTTEVIWKAKDENGNEITKIQRITVIDTTKPAMHFTGSLNLMIEATALNTPVELEIPGVTDIFPVILSSDAPGVEGPVTEQGHITTHLPLGTTKIKWTAQDISGNTTIGIVTVTIIDTTKPELKVPADITLEATAVRTPVEIGQATATDIYPVTVTSDAPEDYPAGTTVVTWTATDANGNVRTGVQKITVVDTTKPILTLPKDVTVEATAVQSIVEIGQATATDIFPVTVISDAPADYPVGTTEVTWTATDTHGNISTGVQTVTVEDTTKPILTLPKDVKVEATAVQSIVEIGQATATDIFPVTITSDAPADYPVGTTEVTWTATDTHGNVSTGVQTVTVEDTTKPILTLPKDVTVEATAVQSVVEIGQATATDIFPVTITSDAPADYPVGTTEVTWTATDTHGNVSTGVQTVTVEDTTKPILTLPKDVTVEATAVQSIVEIGEATVMDIFPVTITSDAPADYPVGTTEVTWTATDAHGNVSTGVQTVTVEDTTKPVLSLPANKTVEATAVRTVVDIGKATATDIFPVIVTNDGPADYPLGTTQVTWKATDESGNVSTGVQTVTVVDTTPPVLKAPADITVVGTGTKTQVDLGQATVTDIFGTTVTHDAPADGFPLGKTVVTWTAADANGNISTAVQNVTVIQWVKVQAYNGVRTAYTNTIEPRILIENISTKPINLSDLKIRYYYTIDGEKNQSYSIDYGNVSDSAGNRNIKNSISASFHKITGNTNSDYYVELSFSGTAGTLKPGGSVQVQLKFWKGLLSYYQQTNDYSFNGSATDYANNSKITVYSGGTLIAGTEP